MNIRSLFTPRRLALVALVLAVLACGTETPTPAPEVVASPSPQQGPTETGGITQQQRTNLMLATVQIVGLYESRGGLYPAYNGSGTIVSNDGLILTNAHVANPPEIGIDAPTPDALGIALVTTEDKPAEPAYFAKVMAIDGYLDLAVLQITETLDGSKVDPGQLNLPFVELGDSNQIHIGDHLYVFGFPGIGGDTITYTQGTVSGFASDEVIGDRSWVKTDATISGGNSGGLGADDNGYLVGVPTAIGAGTGVAESDCRPTQDTNGDNQIDKNDFCVPTSNFISELRPVNLAAPMVLAAKSGKAYSSPYGIEVEDEGSGNEAFGPIAWYTVSDLEQCEANEMMDSFPSGTTAIAAVNSYSGMTKGQPWYIAWAYEGEIILKDKYEWDRDSRGNDLANCLYNIYDDPLPDGTYAVAMFAGPGLPLLTEGEVVVGKGAGPTQPAGKADIHISGTVYDQDTNKPIPGAIVIVLKSGVNYEDWVNRDLPEEDVYTVAKADSKGFYSLPDKLKRNTPYTVAAGAQGYWDSWKDGLVWDDQEPADFRLDIPLTK